MKITTLPDLKLPSLPLPIFESARIAQAVSKDNEKFSIFVGLDKERIAELKKLSLDTKDEDLQRNSSDVKRFGEGSYEEWYNKNRTPFVLINDATDTIAAITWFGPEPLHDGCTCHAAAWRSYNPWRGKGLMKEFTKFTIAMYTQHIPNAKFWVKIKNGNESSIGLAKSLGFEIEKKFSTDTTTVLTTFPQS